MGILDGSSLLAKTLLKHEVATWSSIIMTSSSRVDSISCFFFTLRLIVRYVFVGINFYNVDKFTVHYQCHDSIRLLREQSFYRDLPSVIRMQVCWRITSVGEQIPCEQGVAIALFYAFHLKSLTSVHSSISKDEGIVTVDMTVVFHNICQIRFDAILGLTEQTFHIRFVHVRIVLL